MLPPPSRLVGFMTVVSRGRASIPLLGGALIRHGVDRGILRLRLRPLECVPSQNAILQPSQGTRK